MRGYVLWVASLMAVAACSGSSASTDDTATETTSAPTTTTTAPAPTTSRAEDVSLALLEELGQEVQSWGVSESSWGCVQDGLIEGGHLRGVGEATFFDFLRLDAHTPLAEIPPEVAGLIEGMFSLMTDPVPGCLSPEEIEAVEEFFSANPQGPLTYGSDPTLDMLHDGCIEGTMPDCDMLYLVAEFSSEYEEQAATCGGRNDPIEADTTCMLEYSDVAGFTELATECESGFFVACDALHVVAALGSPQENLAASCGGISEADYVIPCWIVYGLGTR